MGQVIQDGFRWDTGPSVITMRHVFEDLFAAAGRRLQDYLTLLPVDPLTLFLSRWQNSGRMPRPGADGRPDRATRPARRGRLPGLSRICGSPPPHHRPGLYLQSPTHAAHLSGRAAHRHAQGRPMAEHGPGHPPPCARRTCASCSAGSPPTSAPAPTLPRLPSASSPTSS